MFSDTFYKDWITMLVLDNEVYIEILSDYDNYEQARERAVKSTFDTGWKDADVYWFKNFDEGRELIKDNGLIRFEEAKEKALQEYLDEYY